MRNVLRSLVADLGMFSTALAMMTGALLKWALCDWWRSRKAYHCTCGCGGLVPSMPRDGLPLETWERDAYNDVVAAYNSPAARAER